jgi:hypothetical protein
VNHHRCSLVSHLSLLLLDVAAARVVHSAREGKLTRGSPSLPASCATAAWKHSVRKIGIGGLEEGMSVRLGG